MSTRYSSGTESMALLPWHLLGHSFIDVEGTTQSVDNPDGKMNLFPYESSSGQTQTVEFRST